MRDILRLVHSYRCGAGEGSVLCLCSDIAHPRLPSLVSVLFLGTDSPAAEASFIEEPLLTVVETSHSDCSNMKLTSLLNIQQQPNPKVNPKNV